MEINAQMSVKEATEALERYLRIYHSLTLNDVEITDGRGYWRLKELCNETCCHPIHMCLGCEDRTHHTINFIQDYRGDDGRFRSPYIVWKILHNHKTEAK